MSTGVWGTGVWGTLLMGHIGDEALWQWGTWAMDYIDNGSMGGNGVQGYVVQGYVAHGQWGTWVISMGYRGMGHMGNGAHR